MRFHAAATAEAKGPTWGLVLSRGAKPDHSRGVVERGREHTQPLAQRGGLEHALAIGGAEWCQRAEVIERQVWVGCDLGVGRWRHLAERAHFVVELAYPRVQLVDGASRSVEVEHTTILVRPQVDVRQRIRIVGKPRVHPQSLT